MSTKPIIVAVVVVSIAGAFAYRALQQTEPTESAEKLGDATSPALPRLIELGSDSCVSCKAMFPVLDELRATHDGQLRVDFYDVWQQEARAKEFDVSSIPLQVFQGPDGRELFRHIGFYSVSAIRAKWRELGYPLAIKPSPEG